MNYAFHQAELDKLREAMKPARFTVQVGNHGTWYVRDEKYGIPMQIEVPLEIARATAVRFNRVWSQMK